jgi:glycerol-1-phosphate dehydrogenase [NAD(P)+]
MDTIWNLPQVEFKPFFEIQETRPVILITSSPAWDAVSNRLVDLPTRTRQDPLQATVAHWDSLIIALAPEIEDTDQVVVYAVGGGLVADAAKYIAHKLGLPLICLPTALSVDAFMTSASGIRRDGGVHYVETKTPERLIVDLDVIAGAPAHIRTAGICDVLSIYTGLWDWKFAQEQGQNTPETAYIPWVAQAAEAILQGALDCAVSAGNGERQGLKQLLDCLAMEVQLCNQIGHSRPEEGSEHYFAYLVENYTGHGLPHGDLVGPGILYISEKQGQATTAIRQALEACQIPLDHIPAQLVDKTLAELAPYSKKHGLPFGIAHVLPTE